MIEFNKLNDFLNLLVLALSEIGLITDKIDLWLSEFIFLLKSNESIEIMFPGEARLMASPDEMTSPFDTIQLSLILSSLF